MHISDYNKEIKTLKVKENQAEKEFVIMKMRFEQAEQKLVTLRNALTQAENGKVEEMKDLREVQKLSKQYDIPYEIDDDWVAHEWRCIVPVPHWFTDEQCAEIDCGRGDVVEGAYCWGEVLQQVEAFAEYHPKHIKKTMEKILKDERVKEITPACGTGSEYKWEVVLEPGYRVEGYETHTKHLANLEDYYSYSIEPCPKDCNCGQENAL